MSNRSKERLSSPQPPDARGRTAQTVADYENETKGAPDIEKRTEANRPIGNGGGRNRGDRRDMNATYTGNMKHAARGNTPRRDVSTRKR
ncbi:MAG TPA: hypothetical protein VIL86_04975 [Tepidisphaeraceae bacterium]|jgi:hypothetical protein